MKRGTPKMKNLAAKALSNPLFKQRVVKSKKGKGSYSRREKYRPLGR